MGLAELVRSKIALADSLTKDLQPMVTHKAWTGTNGKGDDSYASPVTRHALVDRTRKQRYTQSGTLIITIATVTFLEVIADNGAADRVEPIDPRDVITLSDGTTAPIVQIGDGFEDPGTSRPYLNTVTLGQVVR